MNVRATCFKSRALRSILITLLLISPAAAERVKPAQVRDAIDRGKKYLYALQNDAGTWEAKPARDPADKAWFETGGQWGGVTALVTYSLLAAGESPAEPRLRKAIEFLRTADITGVYALSMRCQVFARLPATKENRQLLQRDAKAMLAMMRTTGRARGFWDYVPGDGFGYSHSRGNYAVLGLWAAAQSGVEIPDTTWRIIAEAWIGHQDPSGGWTYKAREDAGEFAHTPGMTAAGVATLYIAQDFIFPDGAARAAPLRAAIDKGVIWLEDNFEKIAADERYDRDFPYATVYAVERVGLAGGLRNFGKHDWFNHIATWLLKNQRPSGGWNRDNRGSGNPTDTALALLTLARGQAPVAIAKLDYSPPKSTVNDWNLRPRDAANLVRFMGKAIERELNWQIVSLEAPIEDWHEAPILYIEGGKLLTFSDAEKAKLKRYIEQGGMIVAAADASSKAFTEGMKKLGSDLFPSREWRELPADHAIFTGQQFPRGSWKSKPVVLGMSNGVRELIVLLPFGDPPRWWQSNNTSTKDEFWQLGANLHQYAAGRENLLTRGDSFLIQPDATIKPTRTIKIARIRYAGNWDPEPAGWRRTAARLLNDHKIGLEVVVNDPGAELLANVQLAHLTGTDAVKLDAVTIKSVGDFLEEGGTLLVDCAGGSTAFAGAIEPVLSEFIAGAKLEPLPQDHPMLRSGDGKPIKIAYRPFSRKVVGDLKDESRLQCVKLNGRVAIVFSRDDLPAGLVGNDVDGVVGYTPATALQLVESLIRGVAK